MARRAKGVCRSCIELQIKSRWKDGPLKEKHNVEVCKQNSQEEGRLHDSLLKGEENVEMVGEVNQEKEAPCEEGPKMKTTIEDIHNNKGGDRDENIFLDERALLRKCLVMK